MSKLVLGAGSVTGLVVALFGGFFAHANHTANCGTFASWFYEHPVELGAWAVAGGVAGAAASWVVAYLLSRRTPSA